MKKLVMIVWGFILAVEGYAGSDMQCDRVDTSVACLCQSALVSRGKPDTFCSAKHQSQYIFGIGKATMSFSPKFAYQQAISDARTALAKKIHMRTKEYKNAYSTTRKTITNATVTVSTSHSWEDTKNRLIYVAVGMKKSDFDAAKKAANK